MTVDVQLRYHMQHFTLALSRGFIHSQNWTRIHPVILKYFLRQASLLQPTSQTKSRIPLKGRIRDELASHYSFHSQMISFRYCYYHEKNILLLSGNPVNQVYKLTQTTPLFFLHELTDVLHKPTLQTPTNIEQ